MVVGEAFEIVMVEVEYERCEINSMKEGRGEWSGVLGVSSLSRLAFSVRLQKCFLLVGVVSWFVSVACSFPCISPSHIHSCASLYTPLPFATTGYDMITLTLERVFNP